MDLTLIVTIAFLVALFCPKVIRRRQWYLRGWAVLLIWLVLNWFIVLLAGPAPRVIWGLSILALIPLGALLLACYPIIDTATFEEQQVIDVLKKCKVVKEEEEEEKKEAEAE